jgi:hypothetical protein
MLNRLNTKSCCVVVGIALSFVGHVALSNADPLSTPASVQAGAVTAEYNQMTDAFVKHDVDKIMSYFTDDFTEVTSAGATVDRSQERKEYKSQLSKIKSMSCHIDVEGFTPCAAGAYCDLKVHTDGVGIKKVMFMTFQGTFTNELVCRDFWIQTPSGWKLKSRQTITDDTKVNSS